MKKHKTTGTGKGSAYREVDQEKFNKNWDAIFKKKEGNDNAKQTGAGERAS